MHKQEREFRLRPRLVECLVSVVQKPDARLVWTATAPTSPQLPVSLFSQGFARKEIFGWIQVQA